MTSDQERARQIDLHSGNLNAIKTLRETPAFANYFLRRLREKRDAKDAAFHTTSPASETLRCEVAIYTEILGLLDSDERQSTTALETAAGKPKVTLV